MIATRNAGPFIIILVVPLEGLYIFNCALQIQRSAFYVHLKICPMSVRQDIHHTCLHLCQGGFNLNNLLRTGFSPFCISHDFVTGFSHQGNNKKFRLITSMEEFTEYNLITSTILEILDFSNGVRICPQDILNK